MYCHGIKRRTLGAGGAGSTSLARTLRLSTSSLCWEKPSLTSASSGPLKKCYAEQHNLDYEKLMSSDRYKEKYFKDMIRWS